MFERCLIGLHAGAVASLAAVVGISALLGQRLELLPTNHGSGPWLWLASWAVLALLIALPRRPLVAWRLGLALSSAALAAIAVVGLSKRAPLALPVSICCAGLALAAAALGLAISERRVRAVRTRPRSNTDAPPAPTDGDGSRGARPTTTEKTARSFPHVAWFLCAALFVLSFAWARTGADPATIGAGHLGMLIAFFLLLPGLAIATWFPRTAALLWLFSAVLFTLLFIRSQRPSEAALAFAIGGVALALYKRRPRDRPDEVPA